MIKDDNGNPLIAKGRTDRSFSVIDEPVSNGHLQFIPDFGVWHLAISEAAELVALDMWFAGALPEIDEPNDWDGRERDPRLLAQLAEITKTFEARLAAAVVSGRMEAGASRRDFDDNLIPRKTYITYSALTEWLHDRGYEYGDILSDWEETEAEVTAQLCNEVASLRAAYREGKGLSRNITLQGLLAKSGQLDETEIDNLTAAYKAILTENQQLKERLESVQSEHHVKEGRPVSTRQRRTFLTIIAALCRKEGIDPEARGSARRIMEMTDDLGAHVDDGTISKVLSEIADALEARMR
jgi:hypothetical protein